MPDKCKAAQDMANRRWAKTTDKQKAAHTRKMRKARAAKTTAAQRSEIARKGGLAKAAKAKQDAA